MRKDILKLIGEIQELAVQISTRTKHDVMVRYYGHVNAIDIGLHRNGYDSGSPEEKVCDICMDHHTNAEVKVKLKRAKKLLEALKNE